MVNKTGQQIGSSEKGFTLLEMIVVIAIFGILSSVVLFNYSKFTGNAVLTNMAYEMALSYRNAQVFGIAARNTDTSGTADFNTPYGIHVNPSNSASTYTLFADSNGDGIYNSGSDQIIDIYTLERGTKIDRLRYDQVITSGGDIRTCKSYQYFDVIFRRPNPEPVINMNPGSIVRAEIRLASPQGSYRYVNILNNGQVYVDSTSSCT